MTFSVDAVNGIKAGADKRLEKYLAKAKSVVVPETETSSNTADIPF